MNNEVDISIVLGSYNRFDFLKVTIQNIREEIESSKLKCEIIVIEGGSTDGSIKWLSSQKDIISIIQHNRGEWKGKEIERKSWGYFINLGFKISKGKYVCMISDDCLFTPGSLLNAFKQFEAEDGNMVGALAFFWREYPVETKYKVGRVFDDKVFVNHGIYLNKVLNEINFANEDDYFFYHADSDLSMKIWGNGYSIKPSLNSYIEHYCHANQKVKQSNTIKKNEDQNVFKAKWQNYFKKDDLEGSWLNKDFNDEARTCLKFPKLENEKSILGILKVILRKNKT